MILAIKVNPYSVFKIFNVLTSFVQFLGFGQGGLNLVLTTWPKPTNPASFAKSLRVKCNHKTIASRFLCDFILLTLIIKYNGI